MATYYASPTGGGNGTTQSSPFLIGNFWSVARPGDTLFLLGANMLTDGRYRGPSSMISPPSGVSGISETERITIRALNEGGVLLDGEFQRTPIQFQGTNDYFTIEGVNCRSSNYHVVQFNTNNSIARRIVAWDAAIDTNATTFLVAGSNNLFEDIAVFGTGRYSYAHYQAANNTTRRLWFRWEGSTNIGPKVGMSLGYGDTGSHNNVCENCLGTWRALSQPQTFTATLNSVAWGTCNNGGNDLCRNFNVGEPAGIFDSENNAECDSNKLRGCLAYIRDADFIAAGAQPVALVASRRPSCQTFTNIYAANTLTGAHNTFGTNGSGGALIGFWLGDFNATSGNILTTATNVQPSINNVIGSEWVVTGLVNATTVAAAPNAWAGTSGAQLCYRWNGVQTTQPLWPWPMNERIKAATTAAGRYTGPCLGCSGGQSTRTQVDVTADLEAMLGTIPSQCRTDTTPPPPPPPPAANFSGNPTSGVAPLTVQFSDLSTGSPTAWLWTFGDGGTATSQNPSHVYSADGSYTVSLRATNAGGATTKTVADYIVVSTTPPPPPAPPPTANFTANPTSGTAPLTVQFTDTSTNTPTSWTWTFGDGSTSTSQSPSHTYTTAGNYTVSLTATNSAGSNTLTKTNVIAVASPIALPVAQFTATPTTGTVPLTVNFTDLSSNTPTVWFWTFGDGTTSTLQNPSHTYGLAGSYTVSLTATNGGGPNTVTKTNYIVATTPPTPEPPPGPTAPTANFTASPRNGKAPLNVAFSDLSSGDPTGWTWSFGDGATSTSRNPTHTYTLPGRYTVTLRVTNAYGANTLVRNNYIKVSRGRR